MFGIVFEEIYLQTKDIKELLYTRVFFTASIYLGFALASIVSIL